MWARHGCAGFKHIGAALGCQDADSGCTYVGLSKHTDIHRFLKADNHASSRLFADITFVLNILYIVFDQINKLIHTLSMPGKAGLGPLDEKEATLGDNTPFPTTVTVGETFTTGLLT
jgi:hypothetical protein